MKVVVVGANGQLGSDLITTFSSNGDAVSALNHADLDIRNLDSVRDKLSQLRPKIVLNTAAMHHVEACEQEPNVAFAVNGLGARNLALPCRELDSVLIHVS